MLEIINKKCDNSGRILLLEVNIYDSLFLMAAFINIYITNNEPDQLKSLTDLGEILGCVSDIQDKNIVFGVEK